MHSRHMILKMLQVVENESFRLANRMATGYPLARVQFFFLCFGPDFSLTLSNGSLFLITGASIQRHFLVILSEGVARSNR